MSARRLLTLAMLAALLLPALGLAQDEEESMPILWLSFMEAQWGKGEAMTRTIVKQDAAFYDQLLADGAALSWGVAVPINHWPDDNWTHVMWVTFPDWSSVGKFVSSFMGHQMAKSEEQREAERAEWKEVMVPGSHWDAVNRHLVSESWESPPRYINLGFYKTKPGQWSEGTKIYKEMAVPVYEKLQAAGAIGGYGMYAPELHGDYSSTHVSWYGMPDLDARDAVDKAFQEADAARSEEENQAMEAKYQEVFAPEAHQDRILLIVHHGGTPAGPSE